MIFRDRSEAGRLLSEKIKAENFNLKNAVIFALPRGGVPVAYEASKNLNIPLEVLIVRKIGAPENPEYAIGAIAENSIVYMRDNSYEVSDIIKQEKRELRRRVKKYRGKPFSGINIKNKTVVIVDDGLATGATAMAAVLAVRKENPKRIIFACPVGAESAVGDLENKVEKVVCLNIVNNLRSIGLYYDDFEQVSDETVADLLTKC